MPGVTLSKDEHLHRVCRENAWRIVSSEATWDSPLLSDCAELFDDDIRLQILRLAWSRDRKELAVVSHLDQPGVLRGPVPHMHPFFTNTLRHPAISSMVKGSRHVNRSTDLADFRTFRDTEAFDLVHLPGTRFLSWVPLVLDHAGLVFLGAERTRRDFNDLDLRLLSTLRRVLARAVTIRNAIDALASSDIPAAPPGARVAMSTAAGDPGPSDYRPTPKERQVLTLLARGLTSRQIGREMDITERGVRKHLSNIYAKADLPGRAAAASWWERHQST